MSIRKFAAISNTEIGYFKCKQQEFEKIILYTKFKKSRKISVSGFLSFEPLFVFQFVAVTTVLFSYSPSLALKVQLTFNMFQNSMLGMGTERHFKYFEACEKNEPEVSIFLFP
jgi:hypothetical protein